MGVVAIYSLVLLLHESKGGRKLKQKCATKETWNYVYSKKVELDLEKGLITK